MIRAATCLLLVAGALVPGAAGFRAREAEPQKLARCDEFVRIEADPAGAISQRDTEGCGPVSLLNMLKLGPERDRKAYEAISKGDDRKALARLAERYCSPAGAGGKARYDNDSGIDDPNMTKLCEAIAAEFKLEPIDTLYTTRKRDESNAAFARRVNAALVASLSRGVPVVMSIDSYGERDGKWRKLTGHYMLFTGVQRIGPANPASFLVEYVNPAGGDHRQAFVFAGRRKHDGAFAHFAKGDEWLKDDPYLCMASPYTDLAQSKLGGKARHEFFLTILFGRFGK